MSETFEATVKRTIPATAEALYKAWLNPEAMTAFMCPMDGVKIEDVSVDAKVGGAFSLVMAAGEKKLPHHGEYKTLDEYKTLAFTWLSDFSGPDSLVTLTFEEAGDNQTHMTLHHVGLTTQESRDNHEGGWTRIVELLSTTVA
jgi:uncharacterized protein YndB with AHSA1/START domain